MIGKLMIDTHNSVHTEDWMIQLNGLDITDMTNRIVIDSEAMKIPLIHLIIYADLDFPNGLLGEVSVEKITS